LGDRHDIARIIRRLLFVIEVNGTLISSFGGHFRPKKLARGFLANKGLIAGPRGLAGALFSGQLD